MNDEDVHDRATAILEAHRDDIIKTCLRCGFVATTVSKQLPPGEQVMLSGLVIVSGDSLKAARYREMTGKSLPRDTFATMPIFARDLDDYVAQVRGWIGSEAEVFRGDGSCQLVIFVGNGHAFLGVDPMADHIEAEQLFKTMIAESESEMRAFIADPKAALESSDPIVQRLRDIRRPRLDTD